MKRLTHFILLMIFISINVNAQENSVLEDIGQVIRSGNANHIAKHLDTSIEITIDNEQKLYSKAQAQQVLQYFFEKNTPKQFKLIHKSNVKEGKSKYGIGELYTITNKKFRTYFYVVNKKEKYLIRELNFEEK